MPPTITFGESAVETIVEEFGWFLDDEGYIVDEEGVRVESFYHGEEVHKSEFAGVVDDENGDTVVVKDNFVELVEHVKQHV